VPTENVRVPGAAVGIHFVGCPTCPHDNESTTTDDTGRFTLRGIDTAGFTLWVSKVGYEASPFNVAQLPRDQHPEVALNPERALIREAFAFTFQPSDCPDPFACQRDLSFPVHHAGLISNQECDSRSFECSYAGLIRGNTEIERHFCYYPAAWNWPVEAGFVYAVRACGDSGKQFHIVFTHPN
jgi:hypothetical protein